MGSSGGVVPGWGGSKKTLGFRALEQRIMSPRKRPPMTWTNRRKGPLTSPFVFGPLRSSLVVVGPRSDQRATSAVSCDPLPTGRHGFRSALIPFGPERLDSSSLIDGERAVSD